MFEPGPLLRDLTLALVVQALASLALFPFAAVGPVAAADEARIERRHADASTRHRKYDPPRLADRAGRHARTRDHAPDSLRDSARDWARDSARVSARDSARDSARELSRDSAGDRPGYPAGKPAGERATARAGLDADAS